VTIEYRWARGQYDQLPAMAPELVRWPIDVLVAGADAAALSAKAATSTISIVFSIGSDPVKLGLVASFNRPGGNVTGINILTTRLEVTRLGLLHELVRYAASIGVLLHPGALDREGQLRDVQEAGHAIGVPIHVLWASTAREIDATFDIVVQQHISAQFREYAAAGGLMSYGIDLPDVYRQVAAYAGRILKGAKPAELPVLLPTKFELVNNLQTAKELGLTVPDKLLALADEVIE
jgi:putative ABC transport system substrate-binding protein